MTVPSATRFTRTRGRNGTFSQGVTYPSPFFDISSTYSPKTYKEMFQWCRYFFMVHPLVNAVVFKLSQYPIRDVIYHTDDRGLHDRWKSVMEDDLRYRIFQEEAGLDYYAYGNCFVSILFPFVKMLTCAQCGDTIPVRDADYYFRSYTFYLRCKKCGHNDKAKAEDRYVRTTKGARLMRWNPEDIDVQYNGITGSRTYFFNIPRTTRNNILMSKKHVLEEVPQLFIESLKNRRSVVFAPGSLYHFRRPTLSGTDMGLGIPLLMPVFKDSFYLQILKKAQEAIALEKISPLVTLFPSGNESVSAYNTQNLGDWKSQIAQEIAHWRKDRNYYPILGFPIGSQSIGGDGRALLLGQEIRLWSEQILAGMGVPQELVFGGVSFSGSNVSLRMLENFFIRYTQDHLHMLKWIVRSISNYMTWTPIEMSYQPFKMADDLQRQALMFQFNQAGKISDSTLLSGVDLDAHTEDEKMQKETDRRAEALRKAQLQQAEIQGESQFVMAKHQARAQRELQAQAMPQQQPQQQLPQQAADGMGSRLSQSNALPAPQDGGQINMDLLAYARTAATQISQLDPTSQDAALQNLHSQSPELHQLVVSIMRAESRGGAKEEAGAPLPTQRAPRRGPATALI